jgi:hypothetical protein
MDACEGLVREYCVVSVTIVLAEGFDGEGVELVAAGRTYLIGAARTSLLTGMADEVVVDADDGPVEVAVRLVPTAGPSATGMDKREPAPDPAWGSYDVPQGAVLVLDRCDDRLSGRVLPGPLGFA